MKVRQTSANERLKGLINFEIVTAIGTDIEIETIKQIPNIHTNIFWLI
jgi:hypothetical protein